jgi:hypothetical protein
VNQGVTGTAGQATVLVEEKEIALDLARREGGGASPIIGFEAGEGA